MVDTPSQHNQCIRVRQTDEGANELTTFDHSVPDNYTDSEELQNRLSTYALRGKARIGGGSLSVPTLYTMLRFVKAGGVEKVRVEAGHNRAIMHELPVKNQADILYYSGHGHSSTGQLECLDNGGKFTVNDVNPAANWREDLDYFVIAGCSVLRPDAVNGFAWGNATLKAGILRGLCGYHDVAPLGSSGIPAEIAHLFASLIATGRTTITSSTGDLVLDAWLEANLARGQNAIAYDRTNYWYILPRPWPFRDRLIGPIRW